MHHWWCKNEPPKSICVPMAMIALSCSNSHWSMWNVDSTWWKSHAPGHSQGGQSLPGLCGGAQWPCLSNAQTLWFSCWWRWHGPLLCSSFKAFESTKCRKWAMHLCAKPPSVMAFTMFEVLSITKNCTANWPAMMLWGSGADVVYSLQCDPHYSWPCSLSHLTTYLADCFCQFLWYCVSHCPLCLAGSSSLLFNITVQVWHVLYM